MNSRLALAFAALLLLQGAQAAVFAPGVISTPGGESWITFSPDGRLVVFGRHENPQWRRHTIWTAQRTASGWSEPAVAPFSGTYEDLGARFTPDGHTLVFSSHRPRPGAPDGSAARRDADLWAVDWRAGTWSAPRLLGPPLSSDGDDHHSSTARDGTIYFASTRPGGPGRNDLYRAVPNGASWTIELLPAPVSTSLGETDVYVDPDQRFIIFVRTDDPAGLGGDDLFLSTREGRTWSAPRHLGPVVNSKEYEYGPELSPDGKTLYFTSHRSGQADIYSVPTARVGISRSR